MMPSAMGQDVLREAPQELTVATKAANNRHTKKYFFILKRLIFKVLCTFIGKDKQPFTYFVRKILNIII
jgi:hypothetical protein